MRCPKCQTDNPVIKRFCRECGASLALVCPECSTHILPGDRFCGECGLELASPSRPIPIQPSFENKLDKIHRHLPEGMAEKILAHKDKIEGEKRLVTIMFCDMKGFMPLTEELGPEETFDLMDQVYDLLILKVHEYQGFVNELRGDGILALFGAPMALEDAPQKAIRSALAIQRELARFNERIRSEWEIPPILLRIGINTGPVVVGTVGNDLRVQFTVVGDTINMASRMEGLAEPGTVYITEDTYRLAEGFFRFEALGEQQVKGKREPIKAYRVIALSTRRTRFDVNAERGLTSFVGRERELELLLDAFARSKECRGQAFSIVSEAGVGKSRLLYEFRKAIGNENVAFLEGKCLSFSSGVAYHPVIDILKSTFDIQDSDGDSVIRGKVKKGLSILAADESSTLPFLLELLSVKESGVEKFPISPEGMKNRILEAIKRIVLMGSQTRPLVLAIEDLHWIDRSSEESLKSLLESIPGAKVLLLFTYRLDFIHSWGAKSYHSQIMLNRLSNRESLLMAYDLLNTKNLDMDLEELILNKTEGVPFFIEEFVKSLKDLKIIKRDNGRCRLTEDVPNLTIPTGIQELIMARVDSLPETAKDVLRSGSAIEREFSYKMIKRVSGLPEQKLLTNLGISKNSELIYERGVYPDSVYVFKHALTQQVVYDSILSKRRKELHGEIGHAMESLYGESIEEHYGVLAGHFLKSNNHEQGAAYSKLAGKKAEKAGSLKDAIAYGKKWIACLEKLPANAEIQRETIDARTTLGIYLSQLNHPVEAKEAIEPIIDMALKGGYRIKLAHIYTIMANYNLMVEADLPGAFKYLKEALKISTETKDPISGVLTRMWLGIVHSSNCEFEKALNCLQRALDFNIAAKSLWGIAVMKATMSYWAWNVWGKVTQGFNTSAESFDMAEQSDDIYSKAAAHSSHGVSYLYIGHLEDAKENLLKGIDLSEKISLYPFNALDHHYLGKVYFDLGDYEKSKAAYRKAIQILRDANFSHSWIIPNLIALERARVMNGEQDIDLNLLYRRAAESKIRLYEGRVCRYMGEVLLNYDDDHLAEAEDWIKKAIKADEKNGMRWHLGRDHALYADLFKRVGAVEEALMNLQEAIDILKNCGADGWVEKYEEEIAPLS